MSSLSNVLDEVLLSASLANVRNVSEARAELAALRESVATLTAQNAEHTRRLEEARKVIERCSAYIGSMDQGENTKSYMMCDAWLSATAPAPRCTCGMGDATAPEYHAADCALNAPAPRKQEQPE